MDMQGLIIIGAILAITLVFLLGREISCWYFKINKSIKLQEEINATLKEILKNTQSQPIIEKANKVN